MVQKYTASVQQIDRALRDKLQTRFCVYNFHSIIRFGCSRGIDFSPGFLYSQQRPYFISVLYFFSGPSGINNSNTFSIENQYCLSRC